jgi:hypothetical protein
MTRVIAERKFTHVYSLDTLAALEKGTTVFVHGLGRTTYGGIYDGQVQFLAHEFAPEAVLTDNIPLDDLQPDCEGRIRIRQGGKFISGRVSRGNDATKYRELTSILLEGRELAA